MTTNAYNTIVFYKDEVQVEFEISNDIASSIPLSNLTSTFVINDVT